jgi:hypothetical protein
MGSRLFDFPLKKINMKNLFLIIISLIVNFVGNAQNSNISFNPYVKEADLSFSKDESQGLCSFVFGYESTNINASLLKNSTITVCLLNIRPVDGKNSISDKNHIIDWFYDKNTNCFIGTLKDNYELSKNSMIVFDATLDNSQIKLSKRSDPKIGFNVNIQPAAEINAYNKLLDDNVFVFKSLSIVTNTTDSDILKIEIGPNPSKDFVYINFGQNVTNGTLQILSVLGETVYSAMIDQVSSYTVDLSEVASGTYFVKLNIQNSNRAYFEKLIINN